MSQYRKQKRLTQEARIRVGRKSKPKWPKNHNVEQGNHKADQKKRIRHSGHPALSGITQPVRNKQRGSSQNPKMRTIYIETDSRGSTLQKSLIPLPGFRVIVHTHRGANLQELLRQTKEIINDKPSEAIYIFGGICSITEKVKGVISLPHETSDEIYQTTKDLLKAVITDLDKYDATPVVLCPIIGVDLNRMNAGKDEELKRKRTRMEKHIKQDMLDEGILKLNKYIKMLNTERGHRIPEMASVIHKHHGGGCENKYNYKHNYQKLEDGVHPNEATVKYWAKRLNETFSQFT